MTLTIWLLVPGEAAPFSLPPVANVVSDIFDDVNHRYTVTGDTTHIIPLTYLFRVEKDPS